MEDNKYPQCKHLWELVRTDIEERTKDNIINYSERAILICPKCGDVKKHYL